MRKIILLNAKQEVLHDIETRVVMNQEEYGLDVVTSDNVQNLVTKVNKFQPDLIVVAANIVEDLDDWDFGDIPVVTYYEKRDEKDIINDFDLPTYGVIKNPKHLINVLMGDIPKQNNNNRSEQRDRNMDRNNNRRDEEPKIPSYFMDEEEDYNGRDSDRNRESDRRNDDRYERKNQNYQERDERDKNNMRDHNNSYDRNGYYDEDYENNRRNRRPDNRDNYGDDMRRNNDRDYDRDKRSYNDEDDGYYRRERYSEREQNRDDNQRVRNSRNERDYDRDDCERDSERRDNYRSESEDRYDNRDRRRNYEDDDDRRDRRNFENSRQNSRDDRDYRGRNDDRYDDYDEPRNNRKRYDDEYDNRRDRDYRDNNRRDDRRNERRDERDRYSDRNRGRDDYQERRERGDARDRISEGRASQRLENYNKVRAEAEFGADLDPHKKDRAVVISIYSAKGGVGKTTIANNIAVYLALTSFGHRRCKVCIIDYNIDFGDVRATLGFPTKGGLDMCAWALDIRERLDAGEYPEEINYSQQEISKYLQTLTECGLQALLAPVSHAESMDIESEELRIMLRNIAENGGFDFVICDTGNNTRDSSVFALEAADCVLLIANQDIAAATCNYSSLEALERLGFDLSKIKLVINNVMPSKVTGVPIADVEAAFKEFECVARIKNNPEIIAANNSSEPLVYKPNHPVTKDYQPIIAMLTGQSTDKIETEKPKKGLFGKKKRK